MSSTGTVKGGRAVGREITHAMKDALVDCKLSASLQIDSDGHWMRPPVSRYLAEVIRHAPFPVIGWATTLSSRARVGADLTTADHVEVIAVDLSRIAAGHEGFPYGNGLLEVLPSSDVAGIGLSRPDRVTA